MVTFRQLKEDINKLQVEADWKKPEWEAIVKKLQAIRQNNTNIIFAYIIRKTSEKTMEL